MKSVGKSIKISAAAFLAIALAAELGLKYAPTAGIVTVLSIQNTKQETLMRAGKRWLAFLCAIILAYASFSMIGYNLLAFGLYLFLFSLLCLSTGWGEAIAMDSVLVTHFLTEQNMGSAMLVNEALLLLVGTGMGILANLHLHKKEAEFMRLAEKVDDQMKEILQKLAQMLLTSDRSGSDEVCFAALKKALEEAKESALSNYGNTVLSKSTYELDYIAMREQQSLLLKEIYRNILQIHDSPRQTEQVADLLGQIGQGLYRKNTVEGLLEKQERLLMDMKKQVLPQSREEFEARAILFYILMQIRQFLEIKREFMMRFAK